ncbi:hypothetical protein RI129_001144 [Pyrocoelia pectoralis]|uniref:THAP-type domain-containing protein n=1 Tax=Pyrocoelia pectoralis TaxID=417401 RepID=A0AAN7VM88_9COLE
MNSDVYRWCAVPQCNNTSIKTPNKLFIHVPKNKKVRNTWLNLSRRDRTSVSSNSVIYFCEDHFDLPNDMENYMQYHVLGSVLQVHMKPGCIPRRFECQQDRRKQTSNTTERSYVLKKKRRILIEDSVKNLAEESASTQLQAAASSSESSGTYLPISFFTVRSINEVSVLFNLSVSSFFLPARFGTPTKNVNMI